MTQAHAFSGFTSDSLEFISSAKRKKMIRTGKRSNFCHSFCHDTIYTKFNLYTSPVQLYFLNGYNQKEEWRCPAAQIATCEVISLITSTIDAR